MQDPAIFPVVNINGNLFPASVPDPAHERGLIETMLVEKGVPRLEDYHHERLQEGMRRLGIPAPQGFGKDFLRAAIRACLSQVNPDGPVRVRVLLFETGQQPGFTVRCSRPALHAPANLVCGIVRGIYKLADATSSLKHSDRRLYDRAEVLAKEQGWDEGILLNQYGRVAESTIANILLLKSNIYYTPPLSEGCIAGVMRRYLLEHHHETPYRPVIEKQISPEELAGADSIFLINAVRGIRRVKTFVPAED